MGLLRKLFSPKQKLPVVRPLCEPCSQPGGEALWVAISRGGEFAVSASATGHFMVWDAAAGTAREDQQITGIDVACAAVDAQGRRALLGGANAKFQGIVAIADFQKRSIEHVVFHDRPVHAVDISPDGAQIATGGWDWVARVADPETFDTYMGGRHPDFVHAVRFSPDGKELVSVSWDWTLKVWDIRGGALLRSFECEPDHYDVRLSADGAWLAAKIGSTCQLVDTTTGLTMASWEMTGKLLAVSLHPVHGVLVWEGMAVGAQAYAPRLQKALCTLPNQTAPVTGLACSLDGQSMVSSDDGGTLNFWSFS